MSRLLMLALWLLPILSYAQLDCNIDSLAKLPDVRITSVESLETPVPHCKAAGIIGPEIHFELLMPQDWNGKFVMGGGGGFVGSVQNSALGAGALQAGYATVGTDTGHQSSGIDGSWALNNLERLVNFGHQAVHRTAVTAKGLITDYYDADIERNYFMGCSRGGGQALIEAQRYPNDFDGIIAGAPAYSWSGIAAHAVQIQQAMYPDRADLSEAIISPQEQVILEESVLAQCDAGDGISDGFLNDPRQCVFDFSSLPSCAEGDTDGCFSEPEIAAIKTVYDGPKGVDGEDLFYGYPFGGESAQGGWGQWLTGGITNGPGPTDGQQRIPNAHFGFGNGIMKYMVFHDPDWDYSSYSFKNFDKDVAQMAATLNSTNPDLSAFREQGGKLLIYQGWSDAAISALATIGYRQSVVDFDAAADEDVKLFMMPGVLHCGGGKGPYLADFLGTLDQWVETGEAPEQIHASYVGANQQPEGGRPLCAYPGIARYDGDGDDRDPSNFTCVAP